MSVLRKTLVLSAALPLAACAVGPDYHPSSAAKLGVPDSYSVSADQSPPADLTRWWSGFDDPLLTELVDQAATRNLDVGQAIARLRQARESLVQSRAALLPSVSASGSASRNETLTGGTRTTTLPDGTVISTGGGGGSSSFGIGADASYQLDLFGGNARSAQAAADAYQASGYDYAGVLTAVQGEIARNYILARLAQRQLANAQSSLAIQDDNLKIAGWRVQAGLVSSLDAEQARASRAQTAATIPSIQANYNAAVSRLGVLTGRAPGALKDRMAQVAPIPGGPASIAVGIPADTLRQRPDVRSAERTLAAAVARIGVAKAQLYPSLTIGGSLDSNATSVSSLFDVISGRLFANIAQTIFDAGRTRAQVRANEAAADAAFLNYKQTVLTALEDIENAVVALQSAQERERQYRVALDAANNSAILARSQYQAGLADFTTLNSAESTLVSASNSLAQAQADQANALVQLYGALGGGWNSDMKPGDVDIAPSKSTDRND